VGEWALVLALRPHRLGTELWSLEGGKADSVLKRGREPGQNRGSSLALMACREGASGRQEGRVCWDGTLMLSHWSSSPRGLRSLFCSGQAGSEPGVLLKAGSGGLGWAFQAGGGQGAGDTSGLESGSHGPRLTLVPPQSPLACSHADNPVSFRLTVGHCLLPRGVNLSSP